MEQQWWSTESYRCRWQLVERRGSRHHRPGHCSSCRSSHFEQGPSRFLRQQGKWWGWSGRCPQYNSTHFCSSQRIPAVTLVALPQYHPLNNIINVTSAAVAPQASPMPMSCCIQMLDLLDTGTGVHVPSQQACGKSSGNILSSQTSPIVAVHCTHVPSRHFKGY